MSPLFSTNLPPETGSYTPEFTNVSNVTDFGNIHDALWEKIDDSVTVTGKVCLNPTLALVSTSFLMSLPFESDFTEDIDCAGNFSANNAPSLTGGIEADPENNKALFKYVNTAELAMKDFYYNFTYKIK